MNEAVLGQMEAAATALDEASDLLSGAATDMDVRNEGAAKQHAILLHEAAYLHLMAARWRHIIAASRAVLAKARGKGDA